MEPHSRMDPFRIALTGGIATGKSTVSRIFQELGAVILDADRVARDVVRTGSPCSHKLFQLLGPDYFDTDGQLRRRELRDRIIGSGELREAVNAILHPAIMEAMELAWNEHRRSSHHRAVVIFDIPLLFESRLQDRFQLVILVYAPPEVQISRLMVRDGVSRAQAESTLSMQWPIDEKRARAHRIIDNSGALEATRRQVASLWREIKDRAEKGFRPADGSTVEPMP